MEELQIPMLITSGESFVPEHSRWQSCLYITGQAGGLLYGFSYTNSSLLIQNITLVIPIYCIFRQRIFTMLFVFCRYFDLLQLCLKRPDLILRHNIIFGVHLKAIHDSHAAESSAVFKGAACDTFTIGFCDRVCGFFGALGIIGLKTQFYFSGVTFNTFKFLD